MYAYIVYNAYIVIFGQTHNYVVAYNAYPRFLEYFLQLGY